MRWEEMSWDKVRRAQMRWSVECEECSVKCGAWRVQCEVWSVKCEVRSVKCGLWNVKCGVWSVDWGECSVKWEVWSVDCEGCSVKCEDCQVWSVTWGFKCDMWSRTQLSQSAHTHGLGWRTAHASSIDEKGLIYIFKATSAPPRAGTTGSNWVWTTHELSCCYSHNWDKNVVNLNSGFFDVSVHKYIPRQEGWIRGTMQGTNGLFSFWSPAVRRWTPLVWS